MTNLLQRAWAAGFIDGEGCLTVSRCTTADCKREQYQVLIDVAQVKRAPLDRLVEMFGGTVRLGGPTKEIYYWRLYGHKAGRVLEAVSPYLVAKSRQAELLLEFLTMKGRRGQLRTDAVYARQTAICEELRQLNLRRHRHVERLSESAPLAIVANG